MTRSRTLLSKATVRELPPNDTVVPATKFVPLIVSSGAEAGITTVAGLSDEIDGIGLSTSKLRVAIPPAGAGLKTMTVLVPITVMSEAGITAVRTVLLTNVVVRSEPFQRTTEFETKFVPLTVRVN